MSGVGVRVLHRGVPQPLDGKKVAILLVIVMFLPIVSPVSSAETVARNDFDILEEMATALNEQRNSGEDEIARIMQRLSLVL